jgi:hypothetical protein
LRRRRAAYKFAAVFGFQVSEPFSPVADAFFEVDEQLRAANLQSLFRRSWPYALGVLVLVAVGALGVWGWRSYDVAAQGKASAANGQAMTALGAGDTRTADADFAALAKDAPPTFKAMALMQQAAVKLKAGDTEGAAALLDQAGAAAHDKITVDGAKLKAAYILMDSASYDAIRARLTPLAAKDRPFRMLAREALAVEELANGRLAEAKGDFQVLALSPDVSDATRARANAALNLIASGSQPDLQQMVRTAVGLKPAPPPPQGQLTPEQTAALIRAAQARAAQGQAAQGQAPQGGGQGAGAPVPEGQSTPGAPQ